MTGDSKMFESLSIVFFILSFVILLALAVYDLKYYILPDVLNFFLGVTYILFHMSKEWSLVPPSSALTGALVGGGFLFALRALAYRFYKKDSLGLGDVKLMAAAGFGLGFPNIMLAMTVGAGIGLWHGVVMWLRQPRNARKPFEEINVPAGLGLAVGIGIVFLLQTRFPWLLT